MDDDLSGRLRPLDCSIENPSMALDLERTQERQEIQFNDRSIKQQQIEKLDYYWSLISRRRKGRTRQPEEERAKSMGRESCVMAANIDRLIRMTGNGHRNCCPLKTVFLVLIVLFITSNSTPPSGSRNGFVVVYAAKAGQLQLDMATKTDSAQLDSEKFILQNQYNGQKKQQAADLNSKSIANCDDVGASAPVFPSLFSGDKRQKNKADEGGEPAAVAATTTNHNLRDHDNQSANQSNFSFPTGSQLKDNLSSLNSSDNKGEELQLTTESERDEEAAAEENKCNLQADLSCNNLPNASSLAANESRLGKRLKRSVASGSSAPDLGRDNFRKLDKGRLGSFKNPAAAVATNQQPKAEAYADRTRARRLVRRERLPSGSQEEDEATDVDDQYEESDDDLIIRQHNLIEIDDDELFLALDSPPSSPNEGLLMSELQDDEVGRSKRAGGHRGSDSKNQKQTIYFGGFFPWLTDEETQMASTAAAADQSPVAARSRQQPKQLKKRKQINGDEQLTTSNSATKPPFANSTPTSTLISSIISSSSYSTSPESRHQLGRFILPAVRLALDHINKNSSVLSNYQLEIVPRDTQCNATISLKEFFDMVYEEPKKMLLYGDACRVSTDPIAKASYFFDLIQISYADTDPIYTIENYPNFFRVVPSENALSLARIPFIRHFNWTRVGTIYQNLPRYSLPHSKLLTDLERFDIVIKQSVSLPGSVDGLQNRDLGDELRKLKDKDVRIILGNFDEEWALLLFCEAFREKMTGRKYQWILTGISEDKLWSYHKQHGSTCSDQELIIAMDGYITTDITTVTRSQQPTISGMRAHEYSNEYRKRAQEMNIFIEENKFYGYVYDGIWAIALALHRVDYQLKYYNKLASMNKAKLNSELEGLTSLLDFDYHKPIWVKLIRNALNKTRFSGVTGTVSFHKNERPGLISFSQFQAIRNNSEVVIGSYDALNDNLNLKVGFPIIWRGSSPPIDYTIQRVTPFRINRTLFIIISILAIFGILLAIIFLTINIKFRNQRYIKMSSPYLNNLIIIGCILTYTSVIILGLDSGLTSEYNFPYICNARAWVLMAGFTLAFGSMFSKTFRVHSIFTNIKLHKKVIKDYKLFMVVFILLTFDVCILIIWQYFDPFYRETNNGTSIQDLYDEDVIIVPEMEHCQSKRMTIFLSVIYIYKGLLMAFGCFLAWETRHVSIPALNDSKYIGLSVYNVVIMCVIGASLSFVLRDQQDASFVIISIFIIFCSTTTLCLVFVPKLIELKQNPRAGDHRVRATLKTFKKNYHDEAFGVAATCRDIHGNIIHGGRNLYNINERIKILLDENIKQRATLKEKTYELEALTYKYRKIQAMIQAGQSLQAINATVANTPAANIIKNSPNAAKESSLKPAGPHLAPVGRLPAPERVSFSNLRKDITAEGRQLEYNLQKDADLRKNSPLTSSVTQLTTTNTTSTSTNNPTDFTNDYSSSITANNLKSVNNNGSAGIKKTSFVAFDCDEGRGKVGKKQPAGFTPPKNHSNQNMNQILESTVNGKSNRYYNDSSYCSAGNDHEVNPMDDDDHHLDAIRTDSQDLFTVFSYFNQNLKLKSSTAANEYKTTEESKFSQWSKGPFCTLMVKNSNSLMSADARYHRCQLGSPGAAFLKQTGQINGKLGEHKRDTLQISCPNIIASMANRSNEALISSKNKKFAIRKQPPEKQLSQQQHPVSTRSRLIKSTSFANQLPRTISMIEYLGMTEFDLIARRHDKLASRCQQAVGKSAKQTISNKCCYEQQLSASNCSYCLQLQQRLKNQHHLCHVGSRSETEIAGANSSSDPLNSNNDPVNSGSIISCSTCCSLTSSITQSDMNFNNPVSAGNGAESEHSMSQSSQSISHSHSILTASSSNSTDSTNTSESDEFPTTNKTTAAARKARNVLSRSQSSNSSSSIEVKTNQVDVEDHNQHRHHLHHVHHHHPHQHHVAILCQHQTIDHETHINLQQQSSRLKRQRSQSREAIVGLEEQQPLCILGNLYGGPASKETANDAAQLIQNTGAQTTGDKQAKLDDVEDLEPMDENHDKFQIKCDILENL